MIQLEGWGGVVELYLCRALGRVAMTGTIKRWIGQFDKSRPLGPWLQGR